MASADLDDPLETRPVSEWLADEFAQRIGNEIAALSAEQSEEVRELRRQAEELHRQADELQGQIDNGFAGARILLGARKNARIDIPD